MRAIWYKCCGFVESHVTHLYLTTAGSLTFIDFHEGNYPYGLGVFLLAVMEESRDDKS